MGNELIILTKVWNDTNFACSANTQSITNWIMDKKKQMQIRILRHDVYCHFSR